MGNPLALPPSPTSVPSSQPANLTNRFPNGECLDICNVADDREVHSAIVPELRRAVNLPSNAPYQLRRASTHLLVPLSPPSGGGCMPMPAGG